MGDARYQAPELLVREAPSCAADVWASGVTMYLLVTEARFVTLLPGKPRLSETQELLLSDIQHHFHMGCVNADLNVSANGCTFLLGLLCSVQFRFVVDEAIEYP